MWSGKKSQLFDYRSNRAARAQRDDTRTRICLNKLPSPGRRRPRFFGEPDRSYPRSPERPPKRVTDIFAEACLQSQGSALLRDAREPSRSHAEAPVRPIVALPVLRFEVSLRVLAAYSRPRSRARRLAPPNPIFLLVLLLAGPFSRALEGGVSN
jgi:hypothetical protein